MSKGPSIDAYTSSELLGSYAPSGPVSAGDGGVGSGIEASPGQVQTFVHSSRIASSFIKRGVSATGITLIGDFATVLSGGDVGLSDYVASPGVAVNTAGLACPTCEAAAASTKEVKEITQIRCVKKKSKKGKKGDKIVQQATYVRVDTARRPVNLVSERSVDGRRGNHWPRSADPPLPNRT